MFFIFFNILLIPYGSSFYNINKTIPIFYVIGIVIFIQLAYKYFSGIYLFFDIFFILLNFGIFFEHNMPFYWIKLPRFFISIFLSIIILFVGYITKHKFLDSENNTNKNYIY